MKQTFILLAMLGLCAGAYADNLLIGAFETDESQYNLPDAFYQCWQCHYADGTTPGVDTRPNSCFSYIIPGGFVDYNGERITIFGASKAGFEDNNPIVLLDYPAYNSAKPYADFNYSYPITITEEADYWLRGSVIPLTPGTPLSSPVNTVNEYQIMVFVGDNVPGGKTIEVVDRDDSTVLEVRDGSGSLMPSVFVGLHDNGSSTGSKSFEKVLHLTPATKFLTIYAPTRLCMVGNLTLFKDGDTGVADITDAFDGSAAIYYDITGRHILDLTEAMGVVIEVRGHTSRKIFRK